MDGNVLNSIMNPKQLDVAGIMDLRQKRLERDQQEKQKELLGAAIAKAMPGLEKGSVLENLAKNDPEKFMMFSKVFNVPTDNGQMLTKITKDIGDISKMSLADPMMAVNHMHDLAEKAKSMGMPYKFMEDAIAQHDQDPAPFWRSLGVLNASFNPAKKEDLIKMSKDDRLIDPATRKVVVDAMPESAGEAGKSQADVEKFKYFKSLGGADTEEGRQFGMGNGYISKEGREISPFMQKAMSDTIDKYSTASADATRYETLANEVKTAKNLNGGVYSSIAEFYKENTGTQDEITDIKKKVNAIVNSEVIKGLPSGNTSNADVQIFSRGMPDPIKGNPAQLATWLESATRLRKKEAEYEKFKYDFFQKHGSIRGQKGENFIDEWKKLNQAQDRLKSLEGSK